jgi:opacity protein-like surface antigen
MFSRFYFHFFIALFALLMSFCFFSHEARADAGALEISYQYSQRSSYIDDDNYQKSMSHTGSISWYFFDMSAIEISYTHGEGQVSGKASGDPHAIIFKTMLDMVDASLVITLAQKDWAFQPYVKGGAASVDKRIYRTDANWNNLKISHTDKNEIEPSWGVGFRYFLTKNLSIRAGYDRWKTGKSDSHDIWDDAIRAGVSLAF